MAGKFRTFMNEGQKMSGHNNNRKTFYSEVIRKAKELRNKRVRRVQFDLYWTSELSHS